MDSEHPICDSLLLKIQEQIDRTLHLINLLPRDRLNWKPATPGAWTVELLLGHLLDCLAGFCAVLQAAEPARLAHFSGLRNLPVNHACSAGEAVSRIALYKTSIEEGFALLDDERLSETVATAFVAGGETILTLLLGNLEHFINHKHQLFTDLKQMGVEIGTRDLYRFRGE